MHSLFPLNYADTPPDILTACARQNAAERRALVEPYTDWNVESAPDELRVGFVSGDLREHPVGFFVENVFKELNKRSRVRLYAYPTSDLMDAGTWRIRKTCFKWSSLHGLDDESAASLIHNDGIHVLVDLSGETRFNRHAVVARKPAPVQVSWLGFLATSGNPGIDVILGDPYVTPPEEEHLYPEKVWRLPESYQCFTPPVWNAPEAGRLPALKSGVFTFGSLNNLCKLNATVIEVWAKILKAVPDSRLLLKGFQAQAATLVEKREEIARAFVAHGVGSEQVLLENPAVPRRNSLETYRQIDLCLDPWPYNGATTTCEALYMGVPTLTLHGDRFLAHCGESIARNVGLPQFVAADKDEYVRKAVYWAAHPEELANLRADARARMLASPLCDAPRFARYLEQAFFDIYYELYGASHAD